MFCFFSFKEHIIQYTIFIVEEDERNSKLPGEKIDYNERFWWTWDQGRFGFGPYCKFALLTKTLHARIFTESSM
jgi:hypothetical protein